MEQQNGFEVEVYRILMDFGVLLGPVCISFLTSRSLQFQFVFGLVSRSCFESISESKFRCSGLRIQGLRKEGIATIHFSQILFFMVSGALFPVLGEPWELLILIIVL